MIEHNSLADCLFFVNTAPTICMPNYISKLNYVINYLRERGAEELSVFVSKNEDASLENLAQETLLHLEATT
jgi:hypothetical protein